MGDMGEVYNSIKQHMRSKKWENCKQNTRLLKERGFTFESKNNGSHLIVRHKGLVVDFWPSTGKYIIRGCNAARGVFNLIKELEANNV